jgi:hypothetical protein
MSKRVKTSVISFRVPKEIAEQVDERAEVNRKVRADYVKDIFVPAFKRRVRREKREVEPV